MMIPIEGGDAMRTSRHLVGTLVVLALTVVVGALAVMSPGGTSEAADPGIDDMSIDMDPLGDPANDKGTTGTNGVIGSIQTCARINDNGALDADEDEIDTLLIDITAKGIGASDPMSGFTAKMNFPDTLVRVISKDVTGQLLDAFPGSDPVDASQEVPDSLSPYIAGGVDIAENTFESGNGPLARIGIEGVTSSAGIGDLTLFESGIYGGPQQPGGYAPATLGAAQVALNRPCSGGGAVKGDMDCNFEVNAVDALRILRFVAGLDPNLPPDCDPIGPAAQSAAAIPAGSGAIKGDVDCNDLVNAVDALRILRKVAGLNPNLPPDCPPFE
jgi:hypothetical protein